MFSYFVSVAFYDIIPQERCASASIGKRTANKNGADDTAPLWNAITGYAEGVAAASDEAGVAAGDGVGALVGDGTMP